MRSRAAIAGVAWVLAASLAQATPSEPTPAPAVEPRAAAVPPTGAPARPQPTDGEAAAAEPAGIAAPAVRTVPWPPPVLEELPDRDPLRAAVDRAWRLPAKSLAERVARTQRAGLSLGLRDLEGPARGLVFLSDEGDSLSRAEFAVALAPTLPAANAALARARLASGDLPGAWRAALAAVAAVPDHLEARAWWTAVGGTAASYTGIGFAFWFALLGAATALPALSYGLGATRLKLTGPAALAALGAFVMGLALIEGPAGAVLGLAALATASGSATKRVGVVVAVAGGLCALHLGFERVATGRLLLSADPVAVAIHRVEAGLPTPADVGVALRAAASDPDAASAAALYAKRSGDPEAAAQYFARVIEQRPDAATFNNAANVAFARGDVKRAINLYEAATQLGPSATSYYNLSQAYGRAIRLDDQDRALTSAQALDPEAVAQLTTRNGVGDEAFVGDMSFSAAAVAARIEASGAPSRLGALERERWAPGRLGRDGANALTLALGVLGLAAAGGFALGRSAGPRDFYADLARTLRSGVGDSGQRVARLTRLRTQRARTERLLTVLALVVPGAAGFRFGRPIAAFAACLASAAALAVLAALRAAPPDPLAVGDLSQLFGQVALAGCALVYVLSTAGAFVMRVEE